MAQWYDELTRWRKTTQQLPVLRAFWLVGPWFTLKYLSDYWMDCHDFWSRYSCSIRMCCNDFNDPLTLTVAPPRGWNVEFALKSLTCWIDCSDMLVQTCALLFENTLVNFTHNLAPSSGQNCNLSESLIYDKLTKKLMIFQPARLWC